MKFQNYFGLDQIYEYISLQDLGKIPCLDNLLTKELGTGHAPMLIADILIFRGETFV